MSALELTRQGLVRALSAGIVRSARVDAALRARAEDIGRERVAGGQAHVVRRGPGHYTVEVHGHDAAAAGPPASPADGLDPAAAER